MLPTHDEEYVALASRRRTDTIFAIIAALATIGFAWAGYQGAEWVRERFLRSDEAAALSEEALEVTAEADRLEQRDTTLYIEWVVALDVGDDDAAASIFGIFRPELQQYFVSAPETDDGSPAPPFDSPTYDLFEKRSNGAQLDFDSDVAAAKSSDASTNAARYSSVGLIFAAVLAVVGIGSRFEEQRARLALIAVASALVAVGSVALAVSPWSLSL